MTELYFLIFQIFQMRPVHTSTFCCMCSVQQGLLECMCEKQQRVKQQENISVGFDHGKLSNILHGQFKVDGLEDPIKNSIG